MIDWWKKVVLKNYANFQGRARRSEYWYFVLCNLLVIIPLYVIAIVGTANESTVISTLGFGLYGIYALGTIVPGLAVTVRRLHDTNRSGWYYFIGLIPLVGGILLLVWMFTEGDRFQNNYGDDPKNPGIPELEFTGQ
ncbi:MAG: DUF805 domain-containing protein [Chitinophagaceae bacterium]|nr:DUF805 domain-containing protein [Chitinophagaceae bacterium]